jgi:hypothetical protein
MRRRRWIDWLVNQGRYKNHIARATEESQGGDIGETERRHRGDGEDKAWVPRWPLLASLPSSAEAERRQCQHRADLKAKYRPTFLVVFLAIIFIIVVSVLSAIRCVLLRSTHPGQYRLGKRKTGGLNPQQAVEYSDNCSNEGRGVEPARARAPAPAPAIVSSQQPAERYILGFGSVHGHDFQVRRLFSHRSSNTVSCTLCHRG